MNGINKQKAGFKFGTKPTKVVRTCGQVSNNGRVYKLVLLYADGKPYYSLRLYNSKGKFVKQFMFEPAVLSPLINILMAAETQQIEPDIPERID
jgi:hypothetical protein